MLGNSAFDPRRFATAWATSRGVVATPNPDYPPRWRKHFVVAAVAGMGVLAFLVGLVLLSGRSSRSIAVALVAIRPFANGGLPSRFLPPAMPRIVFPSPSNMPFVGIQNRRYERLSLGARLGTTSDTSKIGQILRLWHRKLMTWPSVNSNETGAYRVSLSVAEPLSVPSIETLGFVGCNKIREAQCRDG